MTDTKLILKRDVLESRTAEWKIDAFSLDIKTVHNGIPTNIFMNTGRELKRKQFLSTLCGLPGTMNLTATQCNLLISKRKRFSQRTIPRSRYQVANHQSPWAIHVHPWTYAYKCNVQCPITFHFVSFWFYTQTYLDQPALTILSRCWLKNTRWHPSTSTDPCWRHGEWNSGDKIV